MLRTVPSVRTVSMAIAMDREEPGSIRETEMGISEIVTVRTDTIVRAVSMAIEMVRADIIARADSTGIVMVRAETVSMATETARADIIARVVSMATETVRADLIVRVVSMAIEMVRADLTADHDQDSAVVQSAASVWAEVPVVLFHQ